MKQDLEDRLVEALKAADELINKMLDPYDMITRLTPEYKNYIHKKKGLI